MIQWQCYCAQCRCADNQVHLWAFFWLTFLNFVYISLTLIKFFRTKLSDKYGGYLPLQMCYPDLQRPVPPRNSDLWVTWPVGFPQINPQVLVGDPDSCSPLFEDSTELLLLFVKTRARMAKAQGISPCTVLANTKWLASWLLLGNTAIDCTPLHYQ